MISDKEGEKMMRSYARYRCPHGCCNDIGAVADADAGAGAPRTAVAAGRTPYCRCCD